MQEEIFPKRIRIQGKPGDVVGHQLLVTDAETGKEIPGIHKMTLHLSATGPNTAECSYYLMDKGQVVIAPDEQPIERTNTVKLAEIDITAEYRG